jgi:hypothetical protein
LPGRPGRAKGIRKKYCRIEALGAKLLEHEWIHATIVCDDDAVDGGMTFPDASSAFA